MYDLSTQAGVLRFCESKRAEMARCFERVGQRTWRAEILRNPTRLLEWEAMEWQGLAGRFVDLTEWRS